LRLFLGCHIVLFDVKLYALSQSVAMCYLIVVVFSVLVLIWKLLRIYSWILEDILYVMQGRNLAAFLLERQKLDCRPCDR